MNTTPENLHANEELINYLWLSVEARELLHIIDNRHIYPITDIVWDTISSSRLNRIEKHAELVREIFSREISILLNNDERMNWPNTELQSSYQWAIRSMLYSPDKNERNRMIQLLWNQFDQEEAPKKSLGKPHVIKLS